MRVGRRERSPSGARHEGDDLRSRVWSLATTLPAAPPVSFGEGSRARSSRCEAADRSNNWVSVNFTGSSIRLATTIAAVTTEAGDEAGGAGSNRTSVPGRGHTLPLCLGRNASPFSIILLL